MPGVCEFAIESDSQYGSSEWEPIAILLPMPPETPRLTHSRRLGERLYIHTLVGLSVSIVIIVGALVARHLVGVVDLDVSALVICGCWSKWPDVVVKRS